MRSTRAVSRNELALCKRFAKAIEAVVADIDALATLITGDCTFFHPKAHSVGHGLPREERSSRVYPLRACFGIRPVWASASPPPLGSPGNAPISWLPPRPWPSGGCN